MSQPLVTCLFLISAAIVMKACSTFVAFLALVSKKGMPISSANACNCQATGMATVEQTYSSPNNAEPA